MALEDPLHLSHVILEGKAAALFRALLVMERRKTREERHGTLAANQVAAAVIQTYLLANEAAILELSTHEIERAAAHAVRPGKYFSELPGPGCRPPARRPASVPTVPEVAAATGGAVGDQAAE
jgi:hypothetical protein